ncbi:MAG: hypothetical protein MJ186_04740, partial [Clostridia bacterium]|nr:hypothetical protein [Clostridia bacterium]
MLNTNQFPETIQSMREKFAAQKLEEKRKTNPQAQLSDAEYAEIENILLATVMEMIHNDEPAAAPEKIVKVYKTAVPDIELVPEAERTARREKQIKAASSYAKGLMEYGRYVPGYGDFTRDRAEIRVCRTFTPEEMARYVELHDERGVAADDKEVQRIIFGAIKRVVDEYEEILSRDLSDDEIIERFPDLALKFSIITEGHAMMEKIMKHEYDEYSKELLKQYDKKIVGLMPRVSLTQKKIALIADPNYQYIKLEKILDADPHKLHELDENLDEALSEVDLKSVNVMIEEQHKAERAQKQAEIDQKIANGIELGEDDVLPEEEDDGLQPIDVKDNVLGLGNDIYFG